MRMTPNQKIAEIFASMAETFKNTTEGIEKAFIPLGNHFISLVEGIKKRQQRRVRENGR